MTAFESPTRTFVRDTRVPSNINTFVIGGERIFEPFSIFPSIKGPFKNSYKQIVKNISKHIKTSNPIKPLEEGNHIPSEGVEQELLVFLG